MTKHQKVKATTTGQLTSTITPKKATTTNLRRHHPTTDNPEFDNFQDLASRLVRVSKDEIRDEVDR